MPLGIDINRECYQDELPELTDEDFGKNKVHSSFNIDEAPDDLEDAFKRLVILGSKHHAAIVYQRKVFDMLKQVYIKYDPDSCRLSYDTLRYRFRHELPRMKIFVTVHDLEKDSYLLVEDTAFRRKMFPAKKFKQVYTETRTNMIDMMKFHAQTHEAEKCNELLAALKEKRDITIFVYIDGIAPSNSGQKKMMMVCYRIPCCRAVLNLATIIYERKYNLCADDLVNGLIDELTAHPNIHVELLVADLPERCRLSGTINFNGQSGCITCLAPGEPREGRGGGYVFPFWTSKEPLRDDESFRNLGAVADDIGETVGGVKATSVLFKIPGFSIVSGLAIDPMHLLSGLIKYNWEHLTKKCMTGSQASEMTSRVNKKYNDLIVPQEFKRETRDIDVANFKWNEWKEFEDLEQPEPAMIWRLLMYVVRAMGQGDEWFEHANCGGQLITALIDKIYIGVEDFLGRDSCTANLHNLAHLPLWRDK